MAEVESGMVLMVQLLTLPSFGNAVEIIPREGRTFVFSSKNPNKICKIINAKRKP